MNHPKELVLHKPLPQPDTNPRAAALLQRLKQKSKSFGSFADTGFTTQQRGQDSIRSWGRVHPSQLDKCKPPVVAGST